MNKPIQLISALGVGMAFILSPITAHAEDVEQKTAEIEKQINELQEHIEELQKQVEELQERVTTLEPITIKQSQEAGDLFEAEPIGNWSIRENWLSLEKGMMKEQVAKLLGEAEMARVMPYGHVWFYQSGYIMFDHIGRLERWSKPL